MTISPSQLLAVAVQLVDSHPHAVLEKDDDGNLTIFGADGQYIGFVDLDAAILRLGAP